MMLLVWTNSIVCNDNAKSCLALKNFLYLKFLSINSQNNGQLSLNAKPNSHLAAKYDTNQKQKNPGHFWKKDYPVRHFTSALTRPRAIPKKGKLLKICVS